MGLHFGSGRPIVDGADEEEESEEDFEARVYGALMKIARQSSSRLRSQLGSCVLLGTSYPKAPESVREAIRAFIDEADL
jgi:hypothetical protein